MFLSLRRRYENLRSSSTRSSNCSTDIQHRKPQFPYAIVTSEPFRPIVSRWSKRDRIIGQSGHEPQKGRSFDTFDSLTINIASGSKMEADKCCATDECCSSGRFDCGSLYYLLITLLHITLLLFREEGLFRYKTKFIVVKN